ncbi:zinc-binding dehydrogenase [Rhodobacter sp. 24-YEA-8]|uniref:zinc-binding dehydrogenase n=1 Tax=Rhodobacter sp. 24-YEA-8 TaxID=1884310 RepID=UPI00089B6ABF|nr:zinc-binding dehydrogenase [Rhodobacter sp. 24-YEA-8]SED18632.1 NADPH:quinone reductase [Rhodobacter sp. 24-YEA-8]
MADEMIAWTWQSQGKPMGLKQESRALPVPGPGEVLLQNRSIGLNPVDWKMIEWGHPLWRPGHIPGVDGCGILLAAGAGVRLPTGMRYAYHQDLGRDGSFASHIVIRADALMAVPPGVDDAIAAALPCPGLTAWQALEKLPGTGARDVLVCGGGGAVGLILCQLALMAGWRVWTTASASHHPALLSLGVSGVFDYHDRDWQQHLTTALGPRRLYAAFDTVSGAHARILAPLIGYNGHLICIQDRQESAPMPAFSTALSLHEVALNSIHLHGCREDLRLLRQAGARLFSMVEQDCLELSPISVSGFSTLPNVLAEVRQGILPGKQVVLL